VALPKSEGRARSLVAAREAPYGQGEGEVVQGERDLEEPCAGQGADHRPAGLDAASVVEAAAREDVEDVAVVGRLE
jgi:hypothetical protein